MRSSTPCAFPCSAASASSCAGSASSRSSPGSAESAVTHGRARKYEFRPAGRSASSPARICRTSRSCPGSPRRRVTTPTSPQSPEVPPVAPATWEPGDHAVDFDAAVADAVARRQPRDRVWLHVLLFALTLASTTLLGVEHNAAFLSQLGTRPIPRAATAIWNGLPYSLTILAILGAHEMGHYVACRYYRISATLPFFIPMPIVLTG